MSARPLAPWVRTRLRTSRAAALLLTVLVLGSTFLAAALPRTLDRDSDRAVSKLLTDAAPTARSLTATVGSDQTSGGLGNPGGVSGYTQRVLDLVAHELHDEITQPLAPSPGEQTYGARTTVPRDLTDPGLPSPDAVPPSMNLVTPHDQSAHVRLLAGRLPDTVDAGADGNLRFEIALAKPTADLLHVGVGSVLDTGRTTSFTGSPVINGPRSQRQAVVVGVFEANDPNEAFWSPLPCLTGPCLASTPTMPPAHYWQVNALVGAGALPQLPVWGGRAELFWQLPIDPRHLHGYQLGQAQRLVGSMLDGPLVTQLDAAAGVPGLRPESSLPTLLEQAQQERAAAAPLYAIGPLGAAGVAVVVLLLAAGLAVDRRQAELALLRARGGSLPAIGGRLLAETAVPVLPATLLGTALALVLLPTPRWTAAVLLGVLTGLAGLLPFPVRAVALLRATGPRAKDRRTPAPARTGRRSRFARPLGEPGRLVAELAALALAAGAVLAVRRRGVAPPGSSLDLLLSAAPVLLAVAATVLLARLFPLLLAPGARLAARGRGAVGFLGLARATRGGGTGGGLGGSLGGSGTRQRQAPTVLPLMALLLAVTTAGFGVTVLDSSSAARQLAVRQLVGGDARVMASDLGTLPAGFPAAAAKLPGVRAGTSVVVDQTAALTTSSGDDMAGAMLVMVDPQGYAALSRQVGYGQFDPAVLDGSSGGASGGSGASSGGSGASSGDSSDGSDGLVPALISDNVASALHGGSGGIELPSPYGELRIKPVGAFHRTPAMPDPAERAVIVVSSAAVVRQLPRSAPLLAAPTEWFGSGGGISGAALRGLLAGELPAAGIDAGQAGRLNQANQLFSVATAQDYANGLSDSPLQHAAARLFWTAVFAAAGYSALALLLTLLRAAPERAALLARLRTMGLRPGQGLALILIESLPQTLLAAIAGAAVSWLTVPLLGSAVNLTAMVGTSVPGGLRPALAPVAWQALILAALSCAVVVAETLLAGRRQINTELRAGDQR
ncbi:hypothetical protein [Kitasatospora sp. GAS1066B]|uniref:hypothetical protein n=1 Tax=Kitasatospora sp. GAS1066B TaxID=3156271 RepID=UPI0035152942